MFRATTMFRSIAVLAIAATVAAPTGVWAEGSHGSSSGEVELRHGADDALIQVADDNGVNQMSEPGDDHGDRAAELAGDRPAEVGDDRGAEVAGDRPAEVADDRGADDSAASAAPAPVPATSPPAGQAAAIALSVVERQSSQDWTYSPAQLTTRVGTTLTWTNTGAEDHTVTSDDRTSFDSRNISPNGTFSFTPTAPGTFAYHCAYHPWMKGTLTVTQ